MLIWRPNRNDIAELIKTWLKDNLAKAIMKQLSLQKGFEDKSTKGKVAGHVVKPTLLYETRNG
jgi:hypothetical protein